MLTKRKAKRFQEKIKSKAATAMSLKKGFGYEMPPEKKVVEIYFDQKGFADQALLFYKFYEQAVWSSPKGTPYRNWKLLASDWIFEYQQAAKLRQRQRQNALL